MSVEGETFVSMCSITCSLWFLGNVYSAAKERFGEKNKKRVFRYFAFICAERTFQNFGFEMWPLFAVPKMVQKGDHVPCKRMGLNSLLFGFENVAPIRISCVLLCVQCVNKRYGNMYGSR